MNRKKRKEAGAIAIESILSLTFFLMTILALMMGTMLIRAQAAMQYALNQTAKEISGYFYLLDKFGIASAISGNSTEAAQASFQQLNDSIGHIVSFSGEIKDDVEGKAQDYEEVVSNAKAGTLTDADIERIKQIPQDAKETSEAIKNEVNIIKTDLKNLKNADKKEMFKGVLQVFSKALINTALSKYVTPPVCEALMPKYLSTRNLDNFYQQAGIIEDTINFEGSQMLADGRTISLVVTYQVDASKLTLGFYKKNLQFQQIASTCAWIHPNKSGSLLSLKDVDYFFDVARNEDKAEERNALREANEAAKKAKQDQENAFKDELDHHVADGEETESAPDKTKDGEDGESKDSKDDSSKSDKDDKSKDSKDDKPQRDYDKFPLLKPPGKGHGSAAFWDAYSNLSTEDQESFNYNYNTLIQNYGIDLANEVSECSDKEAALKMIIDKPIHGGLLLANTGDEGVQAFHKLDEKGQKLLCCGAIKPTSDEAHELVEFVNGGSSNTLTTEDIDNFLNRRIKPAEENKLCDSATTAPSRAVPAATTTTQPVYTKNPDKGNRAELTPNNTYTVGSQTGTGAPQYTYQTDDKGRIKSVSGELKLCAGERNSYAQSHAGREDRRTKNDPNGPDDGGHLIATVFNGDGGLDNLVPMNRNLNRGSWEQMEKDWAKLLDDGYKVEVSISVQYSDDKSRPSKFIAVTTISKPGDPDFVKRKVTKNFDNEKNQSYTHITV